MTTRHRRPWPLRRDRADIQPRSATQAIESSTRHTIQAIIEVKLTAMDLTLTLYEDRPIEGLDDADWLSIRQIQVSLAQALIDVGDNDDVTSLADQIRSLAVRTRQLEGAAPPQLF